MPAPLRICHIASEYSPLAKTGGLADVVGALCRHLHGRGHEVRAFLPLYAQLNTAGIRMSAVDGLQGLELMLGTHRYEYSVMEARASDSGPAVHLIDCPALFHRRGLYTADPDEHLRFLLLTRAALECCRQLNFAPHILHCHDWHAAFAPLYLHSLYADERLFAATRTVLTLHNIGYQGIMPAAALSDLDLGAAAAMLHQPDLQAGTINPLRHGILYADMLTTVSPTHAREICTPEYGMGMDELLRSRSDALLGILNGIDAQEWNPATDHYLPHRYDALNMGGKALNKQALLARLKLQPAPAAPLLGIVSRMARQKGFELLFEPLPRLLEEQDVRVAVLGNGEALYEEFFTGLQTRFPGRAAFHRGYHEELAHQIEAGSDMFLMPSLYEPCGLNQMYSLRYGTVPIIRRTGGLADSVQHFDPARGKGTGVVFNDYDTPAVMWALDTALGWYREPALWQRMVANGMGQDFSWERQGSLYLQLYQGLLRSSRDRA